MIVGLFVLGTVVGSFLNVCIYRLPWEKSVIWPGSHCFKCLRPISPQDNIPVVSWIALRGECRSCGAKIAGRYALIEALVGLLFVGVYVVDVMLDPTRPARMWGTIAVNDVAMLAYHLVLIALMVTATFIDYDLMIVPDSVTVPGMIVGVALGAIFPEIRPDPSMAKTAWGGFATGVIGLLAGGGITFAARTFGRLLFRREAMGFGDVMLMGMIGAFLGWQAAVLTFFLSAFVGLGHALWKLMKMIGKLLSRKKILSADRELPLGPYLCMAAVLLMFSWRWVWPSRFAPAFKVFGEVFFLLGRLIGH